MAVASVPTRPDIPSGILARRAGIGYQMPKAAVRSRATTPVLRREYPDKFDDYGTINLVTEGECRPRYLVTADGEKKIVCTYPAPNVQWSRSIALASSLDSAQVNGSPKKRSGLKENLSRGTSFSALTGEERAHTSLGIYPRCDGCRSSLEREPCFSECTSHCTQNPRSNSVGSPSKMAGGCAPSMEKATVRSNNRNRRALATYLLDNGPDVRQALFVFRSWPTVPANHLVKFCMCPRLDFWM
jgi:hypothetical protein